MRLCPDCGTPRPHATCPHCNSTTSSGASVLGTAMLAIGLSACVGESGNSTESPDIEQATIYGSPDSFGMGPGPKDPEQPPPITPQENAPSDPESEDGTLPEKGAEETEETEETEEAEEPKPENIRAIYGVPPSSHLEAPKKE